MERADSAQEDRPVSPRRNEASYAEIFAAFGDPVRLRLMRELAAQELSVSELAGRLELSLGRTSHHLRLLQQKGLVSDRREGKSIRYSLPSLPDLLESRPGASTWGGQPFELLSVIAAVLTTLQEHPEPVAGETPLLRLAAASDLTHVLGEILPLAARACGVQFETTFGSTGYLARQIEAGVPLDLFAAARPEAVERLTERGLLRPEGQAVVARGRLVVWHRLDAPFMLGSLAELARPEVRWVAIADPALAPHGAAAREALEHAELWASLEPRLVVCDNSRQALEFASDHAAAAAFAPLALSPGPRGHHVMVRAEAHRPLDQTLALTSSSVQETAALKVIAFLGGPLARPIFKKYGFLLPEELGRARRAGA